jgi:hypothetical protein
MVLNAGALLLLYGGISATSQPVYDDYTYGDNIKTVQMHVKGWEMSYPVIELGSQDELIFSFDDLDGDVKNYQYSIILCNADWTPSSLFQADYLDGFFENQLDNYRLSFNTFIPYTHYSLSIPNFDVSLKLSGNYIIKVYKDFDPEKPVLTRRFMISEPRVSIDARVHLPQMAIHQNSAQQLTMNIYHQDLVVNDPYSEIFVRVMQNGRKDTEITSLKPTFIRPGEIVYEHEQKMIFSGGNEFRNFDTKSLRYLTESLKNIDFSGGFNHIELHPSQSRQFTRYFSQHDINGRYLIRNEEGRNHSIDADYVMVYFTLPWELPVDNGNVYVLGALSDWNFYSYNEMIYNHESRAYELSMLLKQGYYNYHYVYRQDGIPVADATLFEGNFFETENDYFIMVYHRPPGSRYDRLVGTRQVNSRN